MRSAKKTLLFAAAAFCLQSSLVLQRVGAQDCNLNGVLDADDIANCLADPACADCNGNSIPDGCDLQSILDYAGAASFDPGLPGTSQPDIVVAAQINTGATTGDALPDLVVGDFNSNQIRFLINDGTGMPTTDSASATVGTAVHDLIVADLDNDGLLDVATANFSGGTRDVSVLLRTDVGGELPLGITATHYDLCPGNCGSTGITYGDFDGDSFLDLALSTISSDEVVVLMNDGVSNPGGFTEGQNIAVGDNPFRIVAADLIGTPDVDLAVAVRDAGVGAIHIYPGDGTGLFDTGAGALTLTPDCGGADCGPFGIVAVQLDGANGLDLVTSNQDFASVSVWLEDGAGAFAESQFDVGAEPIDVEVADLDGDSNLDLATANSGDDSLTVLLNDGTNQFFDPLLGLTGVSELVTGSNPRTLAIADLNDDGVVDLASTDQNDSQVSVFLASLPDATEADCDSNNIPDSCDIAGDPSLDKDTNGEIDSCQDGGPVASCQDVTVSVDPASGCTADVMPEEVDDGSTDPAGGDVTLSLSPTGPYALGTTNVLLTVTTVSGLEASCEALVTVVDDAPPELTVPGDATLACDDSTDPANTGTATATDNCPAAAVVTFSDSTAGTPEETVITRTWTATDGAGNTATADQLITVICDDGGGGAGDPEFLRGDADASGEMRIRDAFKLIRFLYRGREIPCEDAADVNDDGTLNYGDVIYLFRSIFFRRRPPPPAPGPFECGVDPTPDELSCESFPPCD